MKWSSYMYLHFSPEKEIMFLIMNEKVKIFFSWVLKQMNQAMQKRHPQKTETFSNSLKLFAFEKLKSFVILWCKKVFQPHAPSLATMPNLTSPFILLHTSYHLKSVLLHHSWMEFRCSLCDTSNSQELLTTYTELYFPHWQENSPFWNWTPSTVWLSHQTWDDDVSFTDIGVRMEIGERFWKY